MENQETKPSNPNMYIQNTDLTEDRVTLRDHFAGLAMQGFLSNSTIIDDVNSQAIEWTAARSYLIANAMLKQRSL